MKGGHLPQDIAALKEWWEAYLKRASFRRGENAVRVDQSGRTAPVSTASQTYGGSDA